MNKLSNEVIMKLKKSYSLTKLKGYCQANYLSSVKKFLLFNEVKIQRLDDINLERVKEFLDDRLNKRKLKIGTVNNYRSALKYLFEVVLEKKWCDKQIPFLSGYKTLPTVFSHTKCIEVINASENILFKALFLTIYSSGMRVSEALNLKVGDIDVSRMQINIEKSKNGSSRKAILGEKNLAFLRKYFKEWWIKRFGKFEREDYLFCLSKKNMKISYTTAAKSFARAIQACNANPTATIHSLRHGFAVYLMEKGTPIGAIKELLGHNSLKSTLIYTKLANYTVMGIKSPLDCEDENDDKAEEDNE